MIRWSVIQAAFVLFSFIAISIIVDYIIIHGENSRLHPLHVTFNAQYMVQQRNYPICSRLSDIQTRMYNQKLKNIYELQLQHKLYCGVEKANILSRKRIPWTGCASQLEEAKIELFKVISNLCKNQEYVNDMYDQKKFAQSYKLRSMKRGIVYTGIAKHYKEIYQSILSLASTGWDLPIEIFTDSISIRTCKEIFVTQFPNVTCYILPKHVSGFTSKFYAIALSTFSEVIFLDADTIILQNPNALFDSFEFKEYGSIWWSDFWGDQCRVEGTMNYGQTAFKTHILYQAGVMDLEWKRQRNISQETEAFAFVLDLNRHLPLIDLSESFDYTIAR